jgi:hypothetical protein
MNRDELRVKLNEYGGLVVFLGVPLLLIAHAAYTLYTEGIGMQFFGDALVAFNISFLIWFVLWAASGGLPRP